MIKRCDDEGLISLNSAYHDFGVSERSIIIAHNKVPSLKLYDRNEGLVRLDRLGLTNSLSLDSMGDEGFLFSGNFPTRYSRYSLERVHKASSRRRKNFSVSDLFKYFIYSRNTMENRRLRSSSGSFLISKGIDYSRFGCCRDYYPTKKVAKESGLNIDNVWDQIRVWAQKTDYDLGSNLKHHEDKELWDYYKRTGDINARNLISESALSLVDMVAKKFKGFLPEFIDLDDLKSYGVFGLFKSIEKFDPSRNIKFGTFSSKGIAGGILDILRKEDWVPRLERKRRKSLESSVEELVISLNRDPNFFEISEKVGVDFDKLYSSYINNIHRVFSLDEPVDFGDFSLSQKDYVFLTKLNVLRDEKFDSPEEEINNGDIKKLVTSLLDKKEKLVLTLYYYENLTMKEIAAILNLTESRVCQIHSKILSNLRNHIKIKKDLLYY